MKDSIAHLHILCQDWQRELTFFKSEVSMLKGRLSEVVSKNTSTEVLAQADHFENKFKIMDTHFDELLHDVKIKHQALMSEAATKPTYINIRMIENDDKLMELMEYTGNDFTKTRSEFYQFLAKYL